jgi:cyclomaltodextrinase / maltogenic alpha-amylase / neopullulanase
VAEPEWVTHAVWWHVYPLGFTGAPTLHADPADAADAADSANSDEPVAHRLPRLLDWLDYAIELGASGLMLGPIFASGSHGYDTTDFFRIDSRLGDDADFDALIAAAHDHGLRVLLDGVFNHVGRGFPLFQTVLHGQASGEESRWFRRTGENPDGGPQFENFEGHDALVALNHDEPAVADYVTSVMNHWLARGADGWRLDAAYAVPPSFWAQVLPRVRAAHPHAYLFGEVIHGDYVQIARESRFDAVTQYEVWKAIWSSLNDRNLFELAHALHRHTGYLDAFVPLTFVGNHDVTRIASQLDEPDHLAHALVVLFTIGGTPAVYYGDEQAFHGLKEERAGGDDAVRPAFPDGGPQHLSTLGWPAYRLHQDLIGLRRRHSWLHRARIEQLDLSNEQFVYRVHEGDQQLCVVLSLGDAPARLPVPGWAARVLLSGASQGAEQPGLESGQITLPAHGWAILGE